MLSIVEAWVLAVATGVALYATFAQPNGWPVAVSTDYVCVRGRWLRGLDILIASLWPGSPSGRPSWCQRQPDHVPRLLWSPTCRRHAPHSLQDHFPADILCRLAAAGVPHERGLRPLVGGARAALLTLQRPHSAGLVCWEGRTA